MKCAGTRIKIFITRRPETDIKHRIREDPNIDIANSNQVDIVKFIDKMSKSSPPFWLEIVEKSRGTHAQLSSKIRITLLEKADGM